MSKVTFDQFNASLQTKSIYFFQKIKSYWPQTFEQVVYFHFHLTLRK